MLTKIFLQMEDFLSYCQSKGLSQKTIFSYDQTLKLFAKYLEVEHKITDASLVSEQVIREYIMSLQERDKYTVVSKEDTKKWNNPDVRTDTGWIVNSKLDNFFKGIYSKRYRCQIT